MAAARRFPAAIQPWTGANLSRDPASGGLRVVAHLVDLAVTAAVQAAVFVVLAGGELLSLVRESTDSTAAVRDVVAELWPQLVATVVISWILGGIYKTVTTRIWGGTLGKLVFDLEVVDHRDGGRVTWRQAALRWLGVSWAAPAALVAAPVQLVPLAGYLIAWAHPQRRTLHDRIANTVVVRRITSTT